MAGGHGGAALQVFLFPPFLRNCSIMGDAVDGATAQVLLSNPLSIRERRESATGEKGALMAATLKDLYDAYNARASKTALRAAPRASKTAPRASQMAPRASRL